MATQYGYEKFFGLDHDALVDPPQVFKEAQAKCPVSRNDDFGFWVVADHANALEVFKDAVTFSTKKMLGDQVSDQWQMMVDLAAARPEGKQEIGEEYGTSDRKVLLFADPPEHGRHRKLIMGALTPGAVKAWEPRIRETAELMVSDIPSGEEIEFVHGFANHYTMNVIADILGQPRDLVPQMQKWADHFNSMVGNPNLSEEEIQNLVDSRLGFDLHYSRQIDERQENPTEDLISRVVRLNNESEQPLGRDDLFQLLQLVMVGGSETSATALSRMIEFLAQHPETWTELKNDPGRLPAFIEEMFRLESPVQGSFRGVTKDVELGGQQLKAGDMLWVGIGASNRDTSVFEHPDEMDMDRKGTVSKYVTFGAGPHTCPATTLSRLELRTVLRTLLDSFSRVELTQGLPEPKQSFNFHGPAKLHVRFTE